MGVITRLVDLKPEVEDRRDEAVGAEDTSELGTLAQVQLAACSDASQGVEESVPGAATSS